MPQLLPDVPRGTSLRVAFLVLLFHAITTAFPAPAPAAEPFNLEPGDRVVLLGSTIIEREQEESYWETALTRRFPGKAIQFRNLGWSGDTVFGVSRAGFGSPEDGFRHLKEHVIQLRPTVLIIAYGTNESFEGPSGLPRFIAGMNKLLDTLAPSQARAVLLAPPRQEDLGRPLPDPAAHNKEIEAYGAAIKKVAAARGVHLVNLFELVPPSNDQPLTSNGLHFTPFGYWRTAPVLERGLGLDESRWHIALNRDGEVVRADGASVKTMKQLGNALLSVRITYTLLPLPPTPREGSPSRPARVSKRILQITGLTPGRYILSIDGKEMLTADAADWSTGVSLKGGPETQQAEQLRKAIVRKNQLYFYRWRPQNETYLFGFRKHEQGQNAREIPQFDPLVAQQEADIARLSIPTAHTYELRPASR